MKPMLCGILVIFTIRPANLQLVSSLIKAWDLLQWNNITIVCPSQPRTCIIGESILKHSGNRLVQIVPDAYAESVPNKVSYSQMSYLTFLISSLEDYGPAIATIKLSQGNSVLLLLLKEDLSLYPWEEVDVPLGFFTLSNNLGLQKIITSRKGDYLIKPVSDNDQRPQRDISSAHLTIQTLTYAPFLIIRKGKNGRSANPQGLLQDALSLMAERGNFTYRMQAHDQNVWMVNFPPEDDDALNATSGVVRSVFDGENDLPLSLWIPTRGRRQWVDFTFYVYDYEFRCFANADRVSNRENTGLLMSPFTDLSWVVASAAFVTLALVREGASKFCERLRDALVALATCAGLLELLLTAYYGGALTMFLASTPDLPFTTQLDGMRDPHWTLLITNGDENFIMTAHQLEEDPELRPLWEQLNSEEFRQLNRPIRKTLETLYNEPNHFTLTPSVRLNWARKQRSNQDVAGMSLLQFCEPVKTPGSLLIPKNSPYKEALNYWILKIRDAGMLDYFAKSWATVDKALVTASFVPINIEQAWLMVTGGIAVIAAVLMTFVFEHLSHRFNPSSR